MRVSDEQETAERDVVQPREVVQLMRVSLGETADVPRDHMCPGSIGRVV
jgi:hypothetical protein